MSPRPAKRAAAAAVALLALLLPTLAPAQPKQEVKVYAAAALAGPLAQIAQDFEQAHPGTVVTLTFGPSGLLTDRLRAGDNADVLASINMTHAISLAMEGRAEPVEHFARTATCILAAPNFFLQGRKMADRLSEYHVRIAVPTPKSDPAGDRAYEYFEKLEATAALPKGGAAALKRKARQLTGGPNSVLPADGRSPYAAALVSEQAEVFIAPCPDAAQAKREQPQLQVFNIPEDVNPMASHGLAVMKNASSQGKRFAAYLLSEAAHKRLLEAGYLRP